MAYQVRFESNAFDADNKIGQLLDVLAATAKQVQKAAGVQLRQDEVNKLLVLRGISLRTFERSMDWADADFDQQMIRGDWKWTEKKTKRKNGEIAGNPRDIIDTGALMQSKKRDVISSSITEFIWTDEVAELVHDGGKTKSGEQYPARPWTDKTIEDIDEVVDTVFRNGGR